MSTSSHGLDELQDTDYDLSSSDSETRAEEHEDWWIVLGIKIWAKDKSPGLSSTDTENCSRCKYSENRVMVHSSIITTFGRQTKRSDQELALKVKVKNVREMMDAVFLA